MISLSLHCCCCTRFLLLGFDLHSTQIRTITLLHSFQTFQLWITKMMSKTLLLTYFYLFIYILLSSAVILYNKVTNYYSFTSILFLPSNLLFIHSSSLSQCSGFYLQSTLIFHFPSHLPWFIWLFLELLLFFLSVFLRFVSYCKIVYHQNSKFTKKKSKMTHQRKEWCAAAAMVEEWCAAAAEVVWGSDRLQRKEERREENEVSMKWIGFGSESELWSGRWWRQSSERVVAPRAAERREENEVNWIWELGVKVKWSVWVSEFEILGWA